MKLYQQLADTLAALIRDGTLQPGKRIPSVRQLCRDHHVSPATAMRAYSRLESQGFVQTRPRSGYYVSTRWQSTPPEPLRSQPSARSTRIEISELVFQINGSRT